MTEQGSQILGQETYHDEEREPPIPEGQALVRPEVGYTSEAFVTEHGLGVSRETTTWRDVPARGPEEPLILQEAARRAAYAYGESIRKMTLGMLGPGKPEVEEEQGPSLYLRPFGWRILELMGFGPLVSTDHAGEFYHPVHRGMLASKETVNDSRGQLFFRWYHDGRDEVFETEVRDYVPRLAGRRRTWLGLKFYEYTQLLVHGIVMWRYHAWVKKHRERLLSEAHERLLLEEESQTSSRG